MDDDLHPVSRDDLVFNIKRALSKAAVLWPRKRMHGVAHPCRPMAREVREHLELCGGGPSENLRSHPTVSRPG